MKGRLLLASAALVSLASFAHAGPAGNPFGDLREVVNGRNCATPEATVSEIEGIRMAVRRHVEQNGIAVTGGNIKVVFHVITGRNNEGHLTDQQVANQIAELNKAYSGFYGGVNTGYTFTLAEIKRTNNRQWFACTPQSRNETNMKNSLAVSPATRLNIYSCKPGQNLLGWAYFPNSFAENNKMHGVVIHFGSVPGGYLAPYNLGGTADHEVGHYLGLYHTFQGGCNGAGDEVADTPAQATATSGCPEGKDTCAGGGPDPIHNYMDYSTDACYTQFTAGQDARMDMMVTTYKPSLINAPIAQSAREPEALAGTPAIGRVEFRGSMPNPFRDETMLRYALPRAAHVTLAVYNVAGQKVATLVDGDEPAGERTAAFRAGTLPAGTYFARLTVGGEQVVRSLRLVR